MKHILIIENDELLSKSLGKYLQSQKYKVSLSEDGKDGLKKIEKINPDLILLDIGIPKVNGFQVLEKLHSHPILSFIPVIVISNSGEPVEIKKTQNLGAKESIIKAHLSLKEVGEKIEKIFSGIAVVKNDNSGQDSDKAGFEISDSSPEEIKLRNNRDGRILLIEDDSFFTKLCKRGLEERSFSVSCASDGEEGLKKFKEEKPDLILLDIIMPKMNGFEVLKKIREEEKDPELANTPVILLTNLYQKADVENGKTLRANAYLVKAITDIDEVATKIKEILGK